MQTETPRIHLAPGFSWDRQPAYLFDIDGTLLRSRCRIHVNSFATAIREVTGLDVSLDSVNVHGSTDTAILRDAFALAGLDSQILLDHQQAILDTMCRIVAANRQQMQMWLLPGVEAALAHLKQRHALLGLGTGNLERIGWIKMEVVGLRQWFSFGGFSDHHPVRHELIHTAAAQARQMLGDPAAAVCIVGDTPRDIAAARANQLPVLAVATGMYSFEQLMEHNPDGCASSLADLLAATNGDTQ